MAEGIQMADSRSGCTRRRPPAATAYFSYVRGRLLVAGTATDPAMRPDGANYTREAQVFGELIRCEIYPTPAFRENSGPILFSRRPPGGGSADRPRL